jgi:hypothetical protein
VNPKFQVTPTVREGLLFPLVVYTAHLTATIADTEGSTLTGASWTFRIAGPAGPAVTAALNNLLVGLRSVRSADIEAPARSAAFERAEPVVTR